MTKVTDETFYLLKFTTRARFKCVAYAEKLQSNIVIAQNYSQSREKKNDNTECERKTQRPPGVITFYYIHIRTVKSYNFLE